MGVSAKVICDSSFGTTRLITLEVEFHRFILPEFNTHRSLSRNFQSSRAVPVEKMIEQVRNNPATPIHWGKNQPGMVAKEEISGIDKHGNELKTLVQDRWYEAAKLQASFAQEFLDHGVHKQIVNRLLEPFMWTKGVTTGTYDAWQAFLKLRAHPDAQPEIQALAYKIKEAIESSVPVKLKDGEWHLPYVRTEVDFAGKKFYTTSISEVVEDKDVITLEEAIKVSVSCAAQVSYRKLDDSLDKALKIYDMLNLPKDGVYPDDPPHFSPTEHIAMATGNNCNSIGALSGNFHTADFIQYRKILEIGLEKHFV